MSIEIDKLINQLEKKEQVRQSLSQVRALIKEEGPRIYFANAFSGKADLLLEFLSSADAKTRKNAALLLGDIADVLDKLGGTGDDSSSEAVMEALYQAYEAEEQLFVKSAYLNALTNYDYRPYLERLRERKDALILQKVDASDAKHINEEIHALDVLIIAMQGLQKHTFTGENVLSDIILLSNRKHVNRVAELVADVLDTVAEDENIKTFTAGVLVHTDRISDIMQLRTYKEFLYQVKGMVSLPMEPVQAAQKVVMSTLMEFLTERHEKSMAPFYFRVEMKANMDLGEKSTFIKKMSYEIEKLSNRRLVNNKSNYELEIRLIETKTGKFNCLVKLYTQKDERFSYRKKSVAASIRPENAALLVELAKEYMILDAKVLDPFCGTGVMLIERQKVVKANTSYGIDIYGEALEGARVNTEAANQIVHYINKDFFDFEHEYLFDEIFTDMPFETGHKGVDEIEEIYRKFFQKAPSNLTEMGRIIMYTHNREFIEKYAKPAGFHILAHEIILEKAGTDLYVLQVE